MANESLMFKKGLLQNLPSTKQAGTIYITTDERAMYVDISPTERIRLGDFIEVANESDLQNAKYQPYSTTALYYVNSSNKLLKYTGTSNSKASFTVINATKPIEALAERVSTNEAAITKLQKNLGNLTDTVTNNKTATDQAIAAEEARAKAAEKANEDAITAEVERAKKVEKTNADNISGLQTSVTNLDNNKANKTELQVETAARIAADDTLTTNLGKVADRTTNLEDTVGNSSKGLVKDVADLKNTTSQQGSTITQMQQNHAGLASTVSNQGSRLSTVEGVVGGHNDRIEELEGTVGNSTSGLVKDVADLKNTTATHGTNITNLQNNVQNLNNDNTTNKANIATNKADISTNKADIATNKANIATNKADIATNRNNIAANTEKSQANEVAISNILSQIGTASTANADKTIHQLITNLQIADNDIYDHINESFRVADAMKFMGQIETTDALLSKTKVEAGHTYVLTKKSGNYAIGDLFIAKADGVNNSIADWVHVPSGYVAAHDPKILHNNSTDSSVVKLISGASNALLGSIKFVAAANTSATVEVSNNNDALNPVVTIGMSWGSF